MAVPCSSSSSVRFLQLELKKLQEEPVEGFRVRLADDSNLFVWEVAIFGPPDTLYEGGYYKVLSFCDSPLRLLPLLCCISISLGCSKCFLCAVTVDLVTLRYCARMNYPTTQICRKVSYRRQGIRGPCCSYADATGLAIWFGSKLPTLAIFPLLVVM